MNSILYFGSDTVKFLRGSAGKNRVTIQDAATVRLDPSWKITTDTGYYLVNGITGAVTTGTA